MRATVWPSASEHSLFGSIDPRFTCEDLQAFPDAGYRYQLLGPSVGPL